MVEINGQILPLQYRAEGCGVLAHMLVTGLEHEPFFMGFDSEADLIEGV